MALNIATKKKGDKLTAEEFNQVVSEINGKADQSSLSGLASVSDLSTKADKTGVYTKPEVDEKVAQAGGNVISSEEVAVGYYSMRGNHHVLYRRTLTLSGLPVEEGASKEYLVDADPLGADLYVSAGNLTVIGGNGIYCQSSHSVNRIYVSDGLETKMVITCDKAGIGAPLSGMVTIDYIKYERVTFSVPLPDDIDESLLSVRFPTLKYDKSFAYSYTFDDDVVQAYGKAFLTINGKWVDDEKFYHVGQARTTGHVPDKTLGYTDGCGNERRFAFGVAIWPNSGNATIDNFMDPTGKNPDKYYPYLVWGDLTPLLDFGNDIYLHNMDERRYDKTDPLSIALGFREDQSVILENKARKSMVLARPDGNNKYITAGRISEDILFMLAENTVDDGSIPLGISFDTDIDLYKQVQFRRYTEPIANVASLMTDITTAANAGTYRWLHDFSHAPADFQYILDLFTDINDTYGKDGDDSIWFASVNEIYEYWYIRTYGKIRSVVLNGALEVSVYVPRLKYGYHDDFSLLVDGLPSADSIVPGDGVIGISHASKSARLLVNVSLDRDLLGLAERYTSIYETSPDESGKSDALYFVCRLREDLRAPFMARITAGEVAPVLGSVSINSGSSTTYERAVSVTLGVTGPITHYKVSESPGLSGVDWIAGTSKTFGFNLSSGLGTKTVYVQVKNQYGESGVKSSSVTLQERPAVTFTVTGKSNNVSYGTVTPATQEVGQGGTANLTATAKSGYVIESWGGASSSTGVGGGSGTATVTNIQADKTVICNFKSDGSTPPVTGEKTVVCFNKDVSIEGVNCINISQESVRLMSDQGNSFLEYKRQAQRPSDSAAFLAVETHGAPYPFDEYKVALANYSNNGESGKSSLAFSAIPGTYKVRLYCNTNHGNLGDSSYRVYSVNGISQTPSFEVKGNVDNYLTFESVSPNEEGRIYLDLWSTKAWVSVPLNVIEIEKTS